VKNIPPDRSIAWLPVRTGEGTFNWFGQIRQQQLSAVSTNPSKLIQKLVTSFPTAKAADLLGVLTKNSARIS
jgi:hypothetical protein